MKRCLWDSPEQMWVLATAHLKGFDFPFKKLDCVEEPSWFTNDTPGWGSLCNSVQRQDDGTANLAKQIISMLVTFSFSWDPKMSIRKKQKNYHTLIFSERKRIWVIEAFRRKL